MKINENISYAKSILNKNGINSDSDGYEDYLKIREICDKHHGYVGILTKLRFVDNVDDMDEIRGLVIDHIIPYYIGGVTKQKNSTTACDVCNKHLSKFIPIDTVNLDKAVKEKRYYLQQLNMSKHYKNRFINFDKQNKNLDL